MAIVGSPPSLSVLLAWPVEHLTDGAEHWEGVAAQSYDAASKVCQDSLSVDWQGVAAQQLRTATHGDLLTTSSVVDRLQGAAKVARSGASELAAARSRLQYAVADAREAGFDIGEDMSIADRYVGGSPAFQAARQAQAEAVAGRIWQRSSELIGLDHKVSARISTAMSGVGDRAFSHNGIRAAGYGTKPPEAPTPTPQPPGPAPQTPYPVNEVVATATDLDGNKVVLRRGYYDGKQGFGWDKIYWKHNITNLNVLKDLISHSRPLIKRPGELIYEVPVNRTHCAHGFLFGDHCEDTGEHLTMRIVVDTTDKRFDVPDGGQKGVITMYPLEGGSGVIQVKPGWTMAPPWVNKNVPIN